VARESGKLAEFYNNNTAETRWTFWFVFNSLPSLVYLSKSDTYL